MRTTTVEQTVFVPKLNHELDSRGFIKSVNFNCKHIWLSEQFSFTTQSYARPWIYKQSHIFPHKCKFCGKIFSETDELYEHQADDCLPLQD